MSLHNRHTFWMASGLICRKFVIIFFELIDDKKLRKHGLKRPKTVPQKTKLETKYIRFKISYL